ncbi:dTDP-glucose 4,6-dehydratase [Bacillus sp. FJAT-50079]|uniref:dTDP-glucose 4,6-dehydratase n=1 Tax=Bacillus sp. FJAT-50079 TaxID=2833577 RepID=UPI001BCA2F3C|nr:dTDP-glucose 4,6-dehydratase [Bacillus sp. FJAT-50079]MBS4208552.1 dTDP-glucose 4,6-dehydratase [Bacillus sp. FJAT-50079]
MNLLITGGAGFIGSHFIKYMINKYPAYRLINYDALTYAGNLENVKSIERDENYRFIKGDIINRDFLQHVVKEYMIDIIVNFAAESHVDISIHQPERFIKSNIEGTHTLLDVAKSANIKKFIQISTDEVYGSLGKTDSFSEDHPLQPNSPYSASKAAADLLVRAYFKTYGLHVNVTRCSNNYGPFQFPEKLIPLLITNGITGKDLPIYDDGLNVRDWLHVMDHCSAIDLVLHQGKAGDVYNIGGHNERTNQEIAEMVVGKLGIPQSRIKYVKGRPGHDFRYAINPDKIINELGWKPIYSFDQGIDETIQWYVQNEAWWRNG